MAAVFTAMALLSAGNALAQATTYTATTTSNYTGKTDFTAPCGVGPCQNFTLAMGPSGSFTTSSPLAANLANASVAASVTSFNFNDGLTTYVNTDSNVRVHRIRVTTNAAAVITAVEILIERWESGTSPHAVGDRFSYIFLPSTARRNSECFSVGVSPAGVADSCTGENADASSSQASGATISWTSAAVATSTASIPTMSEWGLLLMAGLMGMGGYFALRRRTA
jgi:hypothetical protein